MMRTIEAIYNAGRWIVLCPIHGRAGAVLALDYHTNDPTQSRYFAAGCEYVCPVCYPGITAQMTVLGGGRVVPIPDRSARATARMAAQAKDEVYRVVFPPHKEQIEKVLSARPQLSQNWDGPHESLEFLEEENKIVKEIGRERNGI